MGGASSKNEKKIWQNDVIVTEETSMKILANGPHPPYTFWLMNVIVMKIGQEMKKLISQSRLPRPDLNLPPNPLCRK